MKLEIAAGITALVVGGGALFASHRTNRVDMIKADTSAPKVYTVPAFEYHIVTRKELRRIYEASGGKTGGGDIMGFTGRTPDGKIVVFTSPPRIVNDEQTCTLGHEVQHLIWGAYHD